MQTCGEHGCCTYLSDLHAGRSGADPRRAVARRPPGSLWRRHADRGRRALTRRTAGRARGSCCRSNRLERAGRPGGAARGAAVHDGDASRAPRSPTRRPGAHACARRRAHTWQSSRFQLEPALAITLGAWLPAAHCGRGGPRQDHPGGSHRRRGVRARSRRARARRVPGGTARAVAGGAARSASSCTQSSSMRPAVARVAIGTRSRCQPVVCRCAWSSRRSTT